MAKRLALVTAIAVLALPAAAAAPAEAKSGCQLARERGSEVVTKTREAVVFLRRSVLYGCLSSVGRNFRLPDEGGGWDLSDGDGPQLAGRYVAFTTSGSAIGDEFDRVYVYDLKVGRTFLVHGSNFVTDLVVKRNGSVAWIQGSTVDPGDQQDSWEVRKYAHEDRQGVVLVDRGADIVRDSLALSAERTEIAWVRGGTPRTSSLR